MTKSDPHPTRSSRPHQAYPLEAAYNPWRGLSDAHPFFENAEISAIITRAAFYAIGGIPVHFQGSAGLGKTSLALAIAQRLGRPVSFMAGNDWLGAEDMIGKEVGVTTSAVVDRYIQRVRRSESHTRQDWAPSILAEAMEQGRTLIYDEFTRSSAKANGILLSVLEEGILVTTNQSSARRILQAHPEFRIILTSNPHDYAGVNSTPDALLDRMVTFSLDSYSVETRIGLVAARTGLPLSVSARIVRLTDALQKQTQDANRSSLRLAILVARIAAMRLHNGNLSDALLAQITADVFTGRGFGVTAAQIARLLSSEPEPQEDAA
ncbi:AAA family ATPase [Pseudorhodobacter sp. MZDSW-24AT]|uniref:AAA family ATPase n=1 Tax=Pseudorhodobacter sp. MZDSW-24AT TaxID=2052957 RepID=UPI000C1EE67F|nr:AAA family ATPase [Pseudorhodobacter sp. MZDSW-24AT]PJF08880.1 AAA family ATPase [Pseudorhodobacter sp. MZDSW-24AT]